MADKLTPKQNLFIKNYLIDLNATQAAIRAGYSKKTAYQTGVENLKKPQIAQLIKKAMDARAEKIDISAEWVLERQIKIADTCMQRKGKRMIDAGNANRAVELIGKHLGMYVDKHEHTGKDGGAIQVDVFSKALDKVYGGH